MCVDANNTQKLCGREIIMDIGVRQVWIWI
jgi:hypothetical protein